MWRIMITNEAWDPKYLIIGSRDIVVWRLASLGGMSPYGGATTDNTSRYFILLMTKNAFIFGERVQRESRWGVAIEYCNHGVCGSMCCHIFCGRDYLHSDSGTLYVILFWDTEGPGIPCMFVNYLGGDSSVSCFPP